MSDQATIDNFFNRLEEAMFPASVLETIGPPEWFQRFRQQAEARELQGREEFGDTYLHRANELEATEELADAAIYMALALARARTEGRDEQWEMALTVASKVAEAHEYAEAMHRNFHTSISPS